MVTRIGNDCWRTQWNQLTNNNDHNDHDNDASQEQYCNIFSIFSPALLSCNPTKKCSKQCAQKVFCGCAELIEERCKVFICLLGILPGLQLADIDLAD